MDNFLVIVLLILIFYLVISISKFLAIMFMKKKSKLPLSSFIALIIVFVILNFISKENKTEKNEVFLDKNNEEALIKNDAENKEIISRKEDEKETTIIYPYLAFDDSTMENESAKLIENNPEFISVDKYDDDFFSVVLLESDRIKMLEMFSIDNGLEFYVTNDEYNGVYKKIECDKNFQEFIVFVDSEKFDDMLTLDITISITTVSQIYQSYDLIDVEDRFTAISFIDCETEKNIDFYDSRKQKEDQDLSHSALTSSTEENQTFTDEEYIIFCSEYTYDELFFGKKDLEGEKIKINLMVLSFSQDNTDPYRPIKCLQCGAERKTESGGSTYVGGDFYVYDDREDPNITEFNEGDKLTVYGEIVNYNYNTWDGYNNFGIKAKIIEKTN